MKIDFPILKEGDILHSKKTGIIYCAAADAVGDTINVFEINRAGKKIKGIKPVRITLFEEYAEAYKSRINSLYRAGQKVMLTKEHATNWPGWHVIKSINKKNSDGVFTITFTVGEQARTHVSQTVNGSEVHISNYRELECNCRRNHIVTYVDKFGYNTDPTIGVVGFNGPGKYCDDGTSALLLVDSSGSKSQKKQEEIIIAPNRRSGGVKLNFNI